VPVIICTYKVLLDYLSLRPTTHGNTVDLFFQLEKNRQAVNFNIKLNEKTYTMQALKHKLKGKH